MLRKSTGLAFGLAAAAMVGPAMAQVTAAPNEAVADRLLAAQNAERVRLGIKPLVWSAKRAEHAKKWAQALAVSDMMEHSVAGADGGEGENLWFGTKGDYTPEEMIGFFVDEGKMFKRGVGCAIVSNTRRDVLVCRYWPAGNVPGKSVFDYAAKAAAAVAPAAALAPVKSKPKQRASKKRRRGG
jgi:hypothetical protein